jgi:hypothetical protein
MFVKLGLVDGTDIMNEPNEVVANSGSYRYVVCVGRPPVASTRYRIAVWGRRTNQPTDDMRAACAHGWTRLERA